MGHQAGMRLSIYLPDRLAREFDDRGRGLSKRGADLIDRMFEALRRTEVREWFTDAELDLLATVARGIGGLSAAALMGALAREVRRARLGTEELLEKLVALEPFEEIALFEYLESLNCSRSGVPGSDDRTRPAV